MPAPLRRSLSLHLALTWTLLAIYASLYPFAGWRDSGANPLDFLGAGWPRWVTAFDLVTNTAAYLPLGFFWGVILQRRVSAGLSIIIAVAAGVVLSGSLEVLQNYLPSRVASNLDLACNTSGVLLGALAAVRWGPWMLDGGRLARLRLRTVARGPGVEAGLLLLGMWLLIQFDPASLVFGAGDLRRLLGLPAAQAFSADGFREVEAAITASGTLAVLLVAGLVSASRQRRLLPAAVLVAGLGAKTLAHALMMQPAAAFSWATPGSLAGLCIGAAIWVPASRLVPPLQRALAALALLGGTTMVNLAPENPYLEYALHVWNPGQFLNFHGLTRFAASLWPYLILPWLMLFSKEEPM